MSSISSPSSANSVFKKFFAPPIQLSVSELNNKAEKAALKKQKAKEYNAKRYAAKKALKVKQDAAIKQDALYEQKLIARCQEHQEKPTQEAKATEQRAKASLGNSSQMRLRQIRARRALIAAEDAQLRKEEDIEYAHVFDKPFGKPPGKPFVL